MNRQRLEAIECCASFVLPHQHGADVHEKSMVKRGKIIRDTNAGPGLLSIEGQQHQFTLEGVWKSDVAPAVNAVVDVDFGDGEKIVSIIVVPESQLAKEQASVAMASAKEHGAQAVSLLVAKFGVDTLVAMALLVVGWFFLNELSVQLSASNSMEIGFWKLLGLLNSNVSVIAAAAVRNNNGAGIYGFLALVALVAPLTSYFWKDPRAHLAGVLPLVFMLFVAISLYMGIQDGIKQAADEASGTARVFAGLFGGAKQAAQSTEELVNAMGKEIMRAIHIGAGAYLSLAVGVFFAGKGSMKFLASRA